MSENYVRVSETAQWLKRPRKYEDLNSITRNSNKEEKLMPQNCPPASTGLPRLVCLHIHIIYIIVMNENLKIIVRKVGVVTTH